MQYHSKHYPIDQAEKHLQCKRLSFFLFFPHIFFFIPDFFLPPFSHFFFFFFPGKFSKAFCVCVCPEPDTHSQLFLPSKIWMESPTIFTSLSKTFISAREKLQNSYLPLAGTMFGSTAIVFTASTSSSHCCWCPCPGAKLLPATFSLQLAPSFGSPLLPALVGTWAFPFSQPWPQPQSRLPGAAQMKRFSPTSSPCSPQFPLAACCHLGDDD